MLVRSNVCNEGETTPDEYVRVFTSIYLLFQSRKIFNRLSIEFKKKQEGKRIKFPSSRVSLLGREEFAACRVFSSNWSVSLAANRR